MFAGSVAPVLVFYRPDDNRIKEHVGADGFPASRVEVRATGGFPGVRDQNDDAATVIPTMGQRARTQVYCVVDGRTGTIRNLADCFLKCRNIVGEPRLLLPHFLIKRKDRQAIPGTDDLADKVRSRFAFKSNFFMGAAAGINHQGQIKRLGRLRFEDSDFLLLSFIEKLKSFARQVRSGAIVIVEDADEDGHQIDVHANSIALNRWFRLLFFGWGGRGLDNYSGLADRACGLRGGGRAGIRAGGGICFGARLPGFLGPRWAVGVVLRASDPVWQRYGERQEDYAAWAEHRREHWRLGCRFRARCRHRRGREFAVRPDGAVFEVLFLPDRHGTFQGVNGKPAGVESVCAVRSADSDKDAGFANLEAAQAVNDGDAMNAVFFVKLSGDPSHFCEGHGLVGFVLEIQRGAIVRLIADEAIEGNDGAVFRCAHMVDQRMRINRLANKLEDVVVKSGCHCFALGQPPLTGGRKATSSPEWSTASQAANS